MVNREKGGDCGLGEALVEVVILGFGFWSCPFFKSVFGVREQETGQDNG